GRVVVYDRAVLPHTKENLRFTGEKTTMFAVHRDPRTQYSDIVRARKDKKQKEMDVAEFCTMYRSRRMAALKEIDLPTGHAVHSVSFEDLIESEVIREKVRELAGLSHSQYEKRNFLPESSI